MYYDVCIISHLIKYSSNSTEKYTGVKKTSCFSLDPATSDSSKCPAGWTESPESYTCIKAYVDTQTWGDARATCQQDGGDLIKIVNAEMNTLVFGMERILFVHYTFVTDWYMNLY